MALSHDHVAQAQESCSRLHTDKAWSHTPRGMATDLEHLKTEADVEVRVLQPLFTELGYAAEDISPKHAVILQEGRRGRPAEADFVLFAGPDRTAGTALVVVEAKRPGENLEAARRQAESYASALFAPLVLVCDGIILEVWQRSAARPSERLLSVRVQDLPGHQGELRLLLQKDAAISNCEALGGRRIAHHIRDFAEYLRAETERTQSHATTIVRRVKSRVGNLSISTAGLAERAPRGAVVTASSGLGKTSLSYALFRQALARRVHNPAAPLPIHIDLPDVGAEEKLLDFAAARLEARLRGFSPAALKDLLGRQGLVLIVDGFDRVTAEHQTRRETELRKLLRDSGDHLQLFVLSRPSVAPSLDLSVYALEPLNGAEQWQAVEALGVSPNRIVGSTSSLLNDLCQSPLLLAHTVAHFQRHGTLPIRLDDLFRTWLDILIRANPRQATSSARREAALMTLAGTARSGRLPVTEALASLVAAGNSAEVLDDLVGCDALTANGGYLDFTHEALADYLQALAIARLPSPAALTAIAEFDFDGDSLLPVLLMGMLDTHETANALWKRLSGVGLTRFIEVLRYRNDLSEHSPPEAGDQASLRFLQDFYDGLDLSLSHHFPGLRQPILNGFFGCSSTDFKVVGRIDEPWAIHSVQDRAADGPFVELDDPDLRHDGYWVACTRLGPRGLRRDSGRLMAATTLFSAVLKAVKVRNLPGGALWRAERLLSWLSYITLTLRLKLKPDAPLQTWRDYLTSPISEDELRRLNGMMILSQVVQEIDFSLSNALEVLDDWAPDLRDGRRFNLPDDRLANLLAETCRRAQLIYRELVEHGFGPLKDELSFMAAIPVRYEFTVEPARQDSAWRSAHRTWLPVATWDEAGADVQFGARAFDLSSSHLSKVENEFARIGRPLGAARAEEGKGRIFATEGLMVGGTSVESPAMQMACSKLRGDLEHLFAGLPRAD